LIGALTFHISARLVVKSEEIGEKQMQIPSFVD